MATLCSCSEGLKRKLPWSVHVDNWALRKSPSCGRHSSDCGCEWLQASDFVRCDLRVNVFPSGCTDTLKVIHVVSPEHRPFRLAHWMVSERVTDTPSTAHVFLSCFLGKVSPSSLGFRAC